SLPIESIRFRELASLAQNATQLEADLSPRVPVDGWVGRGDWWLLGISQGLAIDLLRLLESSTRCQQVCTLNLDPHGHGPVARHLRKVTHELVRSRGLFLEDFRCSVVLSQSCQRFAELDGYLAQVRAQPRVFLVFRQSSLVMAESQLKKLLRLRM